MSQTDIRRAATALLFVASTVTSASASSLNLSWDRCSGDGNVHEKVLTCESNEGYEALVGSFVLDQTLEGVGDMSLALDFRSQAPFVPSWWDFVNVSCGGQTRLAFQTAPVVPSTQCRNPWRTAAGGVASIHGYTTESPTDSPSNVRVWLSFGLADANRFTAQPGEEVFAFQLDISHEHTTGPGACEGCAEPMCISFRQARIGYRPASGPASLLILPLETTDGTHATVTANGAGHSTATRVCSPTRGCSFELICAAATPAQNRTWGTIKSMYR